MKILYKQPDQERFLSGMGIGQCYFKYYTTQRDAQSITRKAHYHTHYELHLTEAGSVRYEAEGKAYTLSSGDFLLLPPGVLHRVIHRSAQASTFSITFRLHNGLPAMGSCGFGAASPRIWENIRQIAAESAQAQQLSSQLVAGNIWEILVLLWRLCGMKELPAPKQEGSKDPRLTMARQYISDNIERAPSVSEVAAYCHLSTRQLTRLFADGENISPAVYIQQQRVRHIEKLLQESTLSLRGISEKMNFSSEYYFSTFFKSHAGITPGEYRNMHAVK